MVLVGMFSKRTIYFNSLRLQAFYNFPERGCAVLRFSDTSLSFPGQTHSICLLP